MLLNVSGCSSGGVAGLVKKASTIFRQQDGAGYSTDTSEDDKRKEGRSDGSQVQAEAPERDNTIAGLILA